MNPSSEQDIIVQSPIGRRPLDITGSAVGASHMNPEGVFKRISELLQDYINNGNENAWQEIRVITDKIYAAVGTAMESLDAAAPFSQKVIEQVKSGKRLFFKINLVALPLIDYHTHGLGIPGACTEWAFTAAVMRWFHDRLNISYHRMLVGEAGPSTTIDAEKISKMTGGQVNQQSIMEGKYPSGYGGWGFYFVRKYLAERHQPDHTDDPMSGYRESLQGHCLPMGRVTDKLLLYDINYLNSLTGREVPVKDGENYKTITMHRVIVGGEPEKSMEVRNWPGCVLINLPKIKVHISEHFTGALKTLGMGLFSMEVNESKEPGKYKWKYSAPDLKTPVLKLKVPHGRWSLDIDPDTLMPIRDNNGEYIWKKTGGMPASIADAFQAVIGQGTIILHVADLIEAVNIHNASSEAVTVPEGLILASKDPVALDSCAERYLFSMVPMNEADDIRRKYNINSDVIQRVPMPIIEGENIVTGEKEGYDSSFSRYRALEYCEERGLGQRRFHVVGQDLWKGGRLASIHQRLGRVENGVFHELLTTTIYHAPGKALHDLQATIFAYLELNDKLTGADYKRQYLDIFDENGDGVIDYQENGRGTSAAMMALQLNLIHQKIDPVILAKIRFLLAMVRARLSCTEFNTRGHKFGTGFMLAQAVSAAFEMSQARKEHPDPLYHGRKWGSGKWPSLQSILRQAEYSRLYGHAFPKRIDVFLSPYGQAFYYADVKYNNSKYCTTEAMNAREDIIAKYFEDIGKGASPLPFVFYVSQELGSYDGRAIPNMAETDDPTLIFTASFGDTEVWRELRLSEYELI